MRLKTLSALWLLLGLTGMTAGLRAEETDTGPGAIFAGCDAEERAPVSAPNPRDRVERSQKVDRFTQRAFASFSMDDVENSAGEPLCWARLDGVWAQDAAIVLDDSTINTQVWGADSPELLALSTGTYTTLRYIVIVEPDDPAQALYLATGLTGSPFVKFVSSDGLALKDVLTRGGPTKTYTATAGFEYGNRMLLSVTRSGRVRLQMGRVDYYRPAPNASQETIANQLSSDDAFLMSANLEYLPASRRGYDIALQDTFYLNDNDKLEVFQDLGPQHYYIEEKRVIPLSFEFLPESSQGTVYRKSLVSSEDQIQETESHSLGGKIKTGALMAGYSTTKSSMRSMKQSNSVAQTIGYSRVKKYALVLDHAYAELSDAFVDAVEDARRNFRYQALIDKFGTHYPYAVTYGATAKMAQSFTEESYTEIVSEKAGWGAEAGVKAFGMKGTVNVKEQSGTTTGTSGTIGDDRATFVAVGGNGSWDQNGYSAGDSHYPVLLDLRPIWELLNPMNFPGEPEVYQLVRANLQKAVERHLARVTQSLGPIERVSLLPEVEPAKPEPVEEWHVYVRRAWCTGKGVGKVKSVKGKVKIQLGDQRTGEKTIIVDCKKKFEKTTFSYRANNPQLLRVVGTREQIKAMRPAFEMNWIYQGTVFKQKSHDARVEPFGTTSHPFYRNLDAGSSVSYVWKVSTDKWPTFHLRLRFIRIR